MTGQELAEWRRRQPGEHKYKRNQVRKGWSQKMAATWYGVTDRTWRGWEAMDEIPEPVRLAVMRNIKGFGNIAEGLGLFEERVSPATQER